MVSSATRPSVSTRTLFEVVIIRLCERSQNNFQLPMSSRSPLIKSLTRLLPQLPLRHQPPQNRGRLVLRSTQSLVEIFRDLEPDVETDQVGQLERTHGMVIAQLHGAINVRGR